MDLSKTGPVSERNSKNHLFFNFKEMNYPEKTPEGILSAEEKANKLRLLRRDAEYVAQFLVNQFDDSDDTKDAVRSCKELRMNLGCLFAQTEEKDLNRERDEKR